jgi:hypothetical protein
MAFNYIELGWNADLPRPEKMMLSIVGSFANINGQNAFPSVATLALKSGYSRRQTQRILASLVRRGILQVTRDPHVIGQIATAWCASACQ